MTPSLRNPKSNKKRRSIRFFFNGYGLAIFVKFYNTEPLRVVYVVAKNGGTSAAFGIFNRGF